jgi:2-methylcitrate dehydratase
MVAERGLCRLVNWHSNCYHFTMDHSMPPQTIQIARFALGARYEDIAPDIIDQLKRHLLDSLGSAVHAVQRPTIQKLIRQVQSLGGGGHCPAPGIGKTTPDRAAQLFTALTRYPDFMDNFLGKEATCHPSDNIGACSPWPCHMG